MDVFILCGNFKKGLPEVLLPPLVERIDVLRVFPVKTGDAPEFRRLALAVLNESDCKKRLINDSLLRIDALDARVLIIEEVTL